MKVYLLVLVVVLGWFAIIAQFYLQFTSGAAPQIELFIRFFSYFTITTNLLVTICCTTLLAASKSKWAAYFSRQTTLTAITVYIVIVGLVYNIILRSIWSPQGLQFVVNELLHTVIPSLFLIYWLVFIPKNELRWNSFWAWAIYPFAYFVFVFIRGGLSGFYPYPFLDVTRIGYGQALINSAAMTVLFFGFFLLFIALGKWMSKSKPIHN